MGGATVGGYSRWAGLQWELLVLGALRLWEELKFWLYTNITSDACGRADHPVCFVP